MEDGFHQLDTCFLALDLHDTITYSPAAETSVICNIPEISGENNLASKAIRLMAEFIELPKYEIRIHKEIPLQAGLGGGSSNAASAIYCMNKITGDLISKNDLLLIGSACGSDVPFFLSRKACAEGKARGDEINPIPSPPQQTVLLAMPNSGNPTNKMYDQLDNITDRPIRNRDRYKEENDFELVVSPTVKNLMHLMQERELGKTILCGSGSAVACITNKDIDALTLSNDLKNIGYWTNLTKSLTKIEEPQWTA